MKHFTLSLISLFLLSAAALGYAPLNLLKTYSVKQSEGKETSGLDFCMGNLYTVSDKHNKIFQIRFDEGQARLDPVLELENIPKPPMVKFPFGFSQVIHKVKKGWDWEGISCNQNETFFLISERNAAILKVNSKQHLNWLTPSTYQTGQSAGFFKKQNAFLEGITHLADDTVLLAVERAPRGLMYVKINQNTIEVKPIQIAPTPAPRQKERSVDLSGLDFHAGKVYSLERNAQLVCQRDVKSFKIQDCASYAFAENHKEFRFTHQTYGYAEGLAITGQKVFIILDINKMRRRTTGRRQTLLFEFKFPQKWTLSISLNKK